MKSLSFIWASTNLINDMNRKYDSPLPLLHLLNFPQEKINGMVKRNVLVFIALYISSALNDVF